MVGVRLKRQRCTEWLDDAGQL